MLTAHLPRTRLAHLPTPLERAPRLGEALGLDLWIKRDDCTGLGAGGNKLRKLEFTLGEALAQGATALVTAGGYQSNHVRQTAAAAARCGLACHAVVSLPPPGRGPHYFSSGNLLLDRIFGAELHVAEDDGPATEAEIQRLMAHLAATGERPFRVPLGASDAVGAAGYAAAAEEILGQCQAAGLSPDAFLLVTGSAGTHAGLLTGLRLSGCAAPVLGVSSSEPTAMKQAKVQAILGPLAARLGRPALAPELIDVRDGFVGEGYALPTAEANAAIALAGRTEGLVLDPVYTGKAMAALISLAKSAEIPAGATVVFLHTGGSPALFVYDDQFPGGLRAP